MPLFEIAVLEVPTAADLKNDPAVEEKLVLGPITVVAKDVQAAGFAMVMEHADRLKQINKTRMQVLVRPFA